jgi:hypothetical protein
MLNAMRLPTLRDPHVAPVDADEVAVILTTAGLVILAVGVLMLIDSHGLAFGFGPATPTLIIGGVCLIAAVVVKALSPTQNKHDDEVPTSPIRKPTP